ncbi:MAG: glutamate racemase [Oscillospiraceae bacterium]|nr:glutamate racemase [Oscillospiraceae bacterium]
MTSPIVVFDSGLGGISVLKKLAALMPNERYLYFGDSANAPYGTREREEIVRLATDAIRPLLSERPKAIVIACNTATAAARAQVQALAPSVPVIGIRPAVLQAEAAGCRRILTLASASTLGSASYAEQLAQCRPGTDVLSIPTPEIVTYVEDGLCDRAGLLSALTKALAPAVKDPVEAVVLGCTHFPFAKDVIRTALGYDVRFFDAADDVAHEVRRKLEAGNALEESDASGDIEFRNSLRTPQMLSKSRMLFSMPV